MARALNAPIGMRVVRERVAAQFAEVFNVELIEKTRAELENELAQG